MDSLNTLIIELQLVGASAPLGTAPVQAAVYLAIAFGRDPKEIFADPEISSSPLFLDHATFIRTIRRLLPLDESGSRSRYMGAVGRNDLRGLLKIFGREWSEVDEFINRHVPEETVPLNKFIRILAKPIAGQHYPIGICTSSRPLDEPRKEVPHGRVRAVKRLRSSSVANTRSSSPLRAGGKSLLVGSQSDLVSNALARRIKLLRTGNAASKNGRPRPSSIGPARTIISRRRNSMDSITSSSSAGDLSSTSSIASESTLNTSDSEDSGFQSDSQIIKSKTFTRSLAPSPQVIIVPQANALRVGGTDTQAPVSPTTDRDLRALMGRLQVLVL